MGQVGNGSLQIGHFLRLSQHYIYESFQLELYAGNLGQHHQNKHHYQYGNNLHNVRF
jgi:hypothetical protein